MTHEEFKKLELQVAIERIRETPLGFMLEVMRDESYPTELRLEAVHRCAGSTTEKTPEPAAEQPAPARPRHRAPPKSHATLTPDGAGIRLVDASLQRCRAPLSTRGR
jgi:hypothetical protein